MRAEIILLLLFLPFSGRTQDSLGIVNQSKAGTVIDRFRNITGPDANYQDSMSMIRQKLAIQVDRNAALSDSLRDLYSLLLDSEKELLIARYGEGQIRAYDEDQYRDFSRNRFLGQLFPDREEINVFFPFNETRVNFGMYKELAALAGACREKKKSRIVITAFSDSYGDEKVNFELSRQRAESVKEYLVKSLGVDPNHVEIIWLGSGSPQRIDQKEMDFLNRRAVVRLEDALR